MSDASAAQNDLTDAGPEDGADGVTESLDPTEIVLDRLREESRVFALRMRHAARIQRDLHDQTIQDCDRFLSLLENDTAPGGGFARGAFLRPDCFNRQLDVPRLSEPATGSLFGGNLKLFHDADGGVYALSQRPSTRSDAQAPYELTFESYGFSGTYFSMVLSPPEGELVELAATSLITVLLDLVCSRNSTFFIRVNIAAEGRHEVLTKNVEIEEGARAVTFELADMQSVLEGDFRIWVDVIVKAPTGISISFRDFSVLRTL